MTDPYAVVAVYTDALEARIAKGRLEDSGIPARVETDDGGGSMNFMDASRGVRLLVPNTKLEEARSLLERPTTLDD
jgi:hypothetical protein